VSAAAARPLPPPLAACCLPPEAMSHAPQPPICPFLTCCRCITKLFPTRSHTVAAQGGINAALGNMSGAQG
jgi:hypothetical protein